MVARAVEVLLLIPYQDAVGPQVGGVGPIHPGDPDGGIQILGLLEGDDDVLIAPPVRGGPLGAVVPVRHVPGGEVRALRTGVVAGGRQPDVLEVPVVQHALRRDALGAGIENRLRRAGGDSGGSAPAGLVSGDDVNVIGRVVGQAGNGGAGAGQRLAPAGVAGSGGVLNVGVIDLIEGRALGRLPADAQRSVQGGDTHHVRGVRRFGGLRRGGDGVGGLAAPAAVNCRDGELVRGQIFQSADLQPVDLHHLLLGPGRVADRPPRHPVAGDVGQAVPGQAHLPVALRGGEARDLTGRRAGVGGDHLLQELD